jgi:glutamyl/glutaminyl-tRNA synthetase
MCRLTCRGVFDEGAATLRLRMDPGNANRNLDDVVAYRIKFTPHPHVGRAPSCFRVAATAL